MEDTCHLHFKKDMTVELQGCSSHIASDQDAVDFAFPLL